MPGVVPGHAMSVHNARAFLHHAHRSRLLQFLLWHLGMHAIPRHARISSFACAHCTGMLQASGLGVRVAASGARLRATSFLVRAAVALAPSRYLHRAHSACMLALSCPLLCPAGALRRRCWLGLAFPRASRRAALASFYDLRLAAPCAHSSLLAASARVVCVVCGIAIGAWACAVGPLYVRARAGRAGRCLTPASCGMICHRRRPF